MEKQPGKTISSCFKVFQYSSSFNEIFNQKTFFSELDCKCNISSTDISVSETRCGETGLLSDDAKFHIKRKQTLNL